MNNKQSISEVDSPLNTSCVHRLRDIVHRFESFMIMQLERLESEMHKVSLFNSSVSDGATSSGPGVDHFVAELMRSLQDDAERLIVAWQELEAEQRRLLASRSIQQTRVSTPTSTPADILSKTPASLVPRRINSVTVQSQNQPANGLRDPLALDQLQRQVRAHARRA
jgi:hypothetical protein